MPNNPNLLAEYRRTFPNLRTDAELTDRQVAMQLTRMCGVDPETHRSPSNDMTIADARQSDAYVVNFAIGCAQSYRGDAAPPLDRSDRDWHDVQREKRERSQKRMAEESVAPLPNSKEARK